MNEQLIKNLLNSVTTSASKHFRQSNSVMSFDDYLQLVAHSPSVQLRNSAQYFADAIKYFSSYQIKSPLGETTRHALFDAEFDQHEGQVMGQERVQDDIVRHINDFVRARKVDRLILLHGPNGSAKSSIANALARAAEVYSRTEQGALYRFNWVFPLKKAASGSMGFSQSHHEITDSYAHLPLEDIEVRIPCEHKDHPLLLLSPTFRALLFSQLQESGLLNREFPIADILRKGDLSAKNNKIFEALLVSYHGDMTKLLRHIQVERFYLSKRFRSGLTAIEPQMSVDAHARQISANQSMQMMPAPLSHLSLIEVGGPLVDANRGMLEYSDLLKRPIEAWKYLLVATESAQASLEVVSVFFDMVMLASSNESHLEAFRAYPDWQSFKGRFELIKVPYLLRYSDEVKIYENQIPRALTGIHIAPHALQLIARWAVLTRLEPPKAEEYDPLIRDIIRTMTPVEKMQLYDTGIAPERLGRKDGQRLHAAIQQLHSDYSDDGNYEGLHGASPREIRKMLLTAANNHNYDHLSPFAVLEEIRHLLKDKASYAFLRREPIRGFRDAAGLLEMVESDFAKDLHEELSAAMGLVQPGAHLALFERYIKHVSAWTKGEKIQDLTTSDYLAPDSDLMAQVEKTLVALGENAQDFRHSLISQIGAYRLENPDEMEVNYPILFSAYLKRLKDEYYTTQKKMVEHIRQCYLSSSDQHGAKIEEKDQQRVALLRKNLAAIGYNDSSARQALAYVARR